MPELPEVEITARRLDAALRGAEIDSALAPGINALKTFDPPLDALAGRTIAGGPPARQAPRRRRRAATCRCCMHLMSAGRLQLFDKHAGPRDRTSRLLVRLDRRPRAAPARVRHAAGGVGEAAAARRPSRRTRRSPELGPEAWPDPPPLRELLAPQGARPLHAVLRDQHVITGIGRSWVDEILWTARLSPFQRAGDLDEAQATALREAIVGRLGGAIDHYEEVVTLPIPDKLPLPLQVHRHAGEPCPRCGTTIEAIHYESYVLCYCPKDQTGGRVLKDRRLSRLLK